MAKGVDTDDFFRRAKIKRLTADDRDRLIKMRAVPDDFDNVQALHSPYGAAVHGLGTTLSTPVDFGTPSYGDHIIRSPLVVDVARRADGEEHVSPTGVPTTFGSVGFTPATAMPNPDLLSPMPSAANDHRYGYSSQLPSSMGPGPRGSHAFSRHNSTELQNSSPMRSLQPLQLRDAVNRSRSESLPSPLRSSMSWKGSSIDYAHSATSRSPQVSARNSSSGYSNDSIASSSSSGLGFDSSSFSSKLYYATSPKWAAILT